MSRGLSKLQTAILGILESGPLTTPEIAERLFKAKISYSEPEKNRHSSLRRALNSLYTRGLVATAANTVRDARGPFYLKTGARTNVWDLNTEKGLRRLYDFFGGLGAPLHRAAPAVWPLQSRQSQRSITP
jgi:predicted transcriptional regulator